MGAYLQALAKSYETVVRELLVFKRNMAAQDHLIQQLLQYLVSKESVPGAVPGSSSSSASSAVANAITSGTPSSAVVAAAAAAAAGTLPISSLMRLTEGTPSSAGTVAGPADGGAPSGDFAPTPTLASHAAKDLADVAPPSAPERRPSEPAGIPAGAHMWSPAELTQYAANAGGDGYSAPAISEASLSVMDELSRRYSKDRDSLTVTTVF